MQRQVCIAHNRDQLNREMETSRGNGFERHLSTFCILKPSSVERHNEANYMGGRVITDLDVEEEEDDWDNYVVLFRLDCSTSRLHAILDVLLYCKHDDGEELLHDSSVSAQ